MKLRVRGRKHVAPVLCAISLPLSAACALVFTGAVASAQAAPTAPPDSTPAAPPVVSSGRTIGQIIVSGNKTLSDAAIIAMSRHQVGDPCNDQVLGEIITNLVNTGLFGTQHDLSNSDDWVKVHTEESSTDPNKCKVVIEVEENDPVKNISITGSGPIKIEEIRNLLHVKVGSVYNSMQFNRDIQDIEHLYNSRGYVALPGADAGMDDRGVLNIPLVVVRVAEIRIVKNRKTKRFVILRELKTKEGDYFNRDVWIRDRVRLLNMDLFEEVDPQEESVGTGLVRLTLSVPEKRTGQISVGAGYSSREQLIGRAEVSETNFRGRAETISLTWEEGALTNRSSVELGFTEPYLDRKHTALSVQVYDKTVYRFANSLINATPIVGTGGTTDFDQYNEQRIGLQATVSRPIKDTMRIAFTGRAENVSTAQNDLTGFNASIIQNGPIESIGGSLAHDTRDLIVDPVTGHFVSGSFTVGHADIKPADPANLGTVPGVFGTHNFGKSSLEARQFFNLQSPRRRDKPDEQKTIVALRALMGTSTGTLPFFEQYFVGGAESLRGYREDRFWGQYMMLGSAELRKPLARGLTGVLFTDIGDAWGGPYSNVNIQGFTQGGFRPHLGVGAGVRVRTPLGPIRLDYGFGDDGGQFYFSIGNVF